MQNIEWGCTSKEIYPLRWPFSLEKVRMMWWKNDTLSNNEIALIEI